MSEDALRAIILDNDETTGSYTLVYSILIGITTVKGITQENYGIILKRLASWMIAHNVFRPGLKGVIETISHLKKKMVIDTVIMYTNQTGEDIPIQINGRERITSLPRTIAFMMEYINDSKPVFDLILTRPLNGKYLSNGWCPKKFSRVLKFYPNKPKDIRNMIFIDDMGTPEYIYAHDILDTRKSKESWYQIPPYYRYLSTSEIHDCLRTCFEDIYDLEKNRMLRDVIVDCYEDHYHKEPSSLPNAAHFMMLSEHLRSRFPVPV